MKGLYIHIPFCVHKCDYCDFVSFPGQEAYFDEYIGALIHEMAEYRGEAVDTVFFGGGTPSVLSEEQLTRLCTAVRDHFDVAPDAEWTTEANPGTLTYGKARALIKGGVNRISVGVQSFKDAELRAVGRIHDAKTAYETVRMLARAGFQNISIDLMASLPMQTEESFMQSLQAAVTLPIKHISVYSLIIEEGTPLSCKYADGVYSEPDEEADRRLYHKTKDFLHNNGFERYEVSNYAVPGWESRHNLKYWDCAEYIGLGVAAHSYLDGVRFSDTEDLARYIAGDFRGDERELLTEKDKMGEFMILGLRKTAGVSAADFEKRFKTGIDCVYGDILNKYIKLGMIVHANGFYRFTDAGTDVENAVLCEFV